MSSITVCMSCSEMRSQDFDANPGYFSDSSRSIERYPRMVEGLLMPSLASIYRFRESEKAMDSI